MDGVTRDRERAASHDLDLAAAFAALPGATAVFAADSPRFTVLAASDALLAGRPRDAVVGRPLERAFPNASPEDPEASGLASLRASLAAVVRTGEPQHMARQRYDLQRPDGAWEVRYRDAVNVAVRGPDGAVRQVVHQTTDVTERVRAEAELQRATAHDAYRVALTDALRGAEDPIEAQAVAMRVLGDHLGVSRVMFCEADPGSVETFTNYREYRRDPAMPTSLGRHCWDDFGAYLATELRAGRTLVVVDVRTQAPHSAEDLAGYEAVGIRAYLAVPLVREGRIVAYLAVNHATPHAWTADEIALVEETAGRTWAAVERARAETTLRASEEQFRRSIEDAPIPVIMHAEDGEVLQVSRTWTELTGYALEDVPTFDAWLTRAYGEGADAVRTHVHALFAGRRRTMSVGFPVRTRAGETRHWSFSASAPGTLHDGRRFVVGMALDVTERERAEAALRASEARYRTLVENVHDYAIFMVDPGGLVAEWTAGAARVKGYDAAEVVGRHVSLFYTPEDVAAGEVEREMAEAAATGRAEREGWRVRKGGTRFWVNEIMTAVYGADGRVAGFTKISRDLTDRRLAEQAAERERTDRAREALRRQLAVAEEAERRRLARELHEQLGQGLTAFALGLEDAERHGASADAGTAGDGAPLRARLAELKALAKEMTVRARYVALELRPPELDDMGLEHALATYVREWSARYGVAAEVEASGVSGRVPAEVGSALYRIAQEALTNVATHARARQVSVVVERSGGEVRMIVEDDGRGFDADTTPERARAERRLGLAGMRERAALVGGTVTVESSEGRGTTLFVRVAVSHGDGLPLDGAVRGATA